MSIILGAGISLIKGALARNTIGVDPDVLAAIEDIEHKVGLTDEVKAAYNAYDGRYEGDTPHCNNSEDTSYINYASKRFATWDTAHWVKMTKTRLGNISDHLNFAMRGYTPLGAGIKSIFTKPIYLIPICILVFVILFLALRR